jgi:uncharacterized protein YkwD
VRRLSVLILFLCLAGCDGGAPGLLASGEPATEAGLSGGQEEVAAGLDSNCSTPKDVEALDDQLLRLINIERFDVGTVGPDSQLSAIAANYACEMVDDRFFGHVHPKTDATIADRVEASEYPYEVVGENLAAGYWDPQEVVDAWMASPAHREILLDPAFTRIGVAVRYGGEHGVYWVLILADPAE